MIARVLQAGGGTYRVWAGGRDFDCSLRGRIKQDEDGPVAVGDRVEVEALDDGSCRIRRVLPRKSALIRRAVARRRNQVMAANVDQVAAVVAAARPGPDLYMLDRLLAVAEFDDLEAFIVLNKTDLLNETDLRDETYLRDGSDLLNRADLRDRLPADVAGYADLGYEILPTSALDRTGVQALRERLTNRISVLAGPSGVGKSSLLNTLMPGLDLRVGDVGDRSGRGRHTTTSARLIPLNDDTFIADTPGIQHFVPAELEVATLGHCFREFRPYLGHCRFADCRHREEPGCAIRAAIEAGELLGRRHESYLTLLEATEAAEREARESGSAG